MDPKLTILFMLTSVVLVLFHLSEGTFDRVLQQITGRNRRAASRQRLLSNSRN